MSDRVNTSGYTCSHYETEMERLERTNKKMKQRIDELEKENANIPFCHHEINILVEGLKAADRRIAELEADLGSPADEQDEMYRRWQIEWMREIRTAVIVSEEQGEVEKFRKNTKDEDEAAVYSQILNYIDEGDLEQRDIEKIIEQVLALSSREGSEWHRILLSDLHHPKSLKQVVFAGDTMLDEPSSILIVGELPVSRRKG